MLKIKFTSLQVLKVNHDKEKLFILFWQFSTSIEAKIIFILIIFLSDSNKVDFTIMPDFLYLTLDAGA
jgi:hypothetical protein